MRSLLPQDHSNFYLSQTAASRRLRDYGAVFPGIPPMPKATVPNFILSQKLREPVDSRFQRRSEYILPGAPYMGQGLARQPSATCNPGGLNTDGAPFIGQGFEGPLSGSSRDSPFQQHSQLPLPGWSPQALECEVNSWVPGQTLRFDRVSAETKFTFQPTSSSLYGALGNGFQERSTVVVTTPAPPLPQTQHDLPAASTPAIDPRALPDAIPIIPSTATSAGIPAPTAITFSLPQEAKQNHNKRSNKDNGNPRHGSETVSEDVDHHEIGQAKRTDLRADRHYPRKIAPKPEIGGLGYREHRAGSSSSYFRKIAPKPKNRSQEKEETEKSGSLNVGACATRRFRIIRPSSRMVGELKREE